MNLNWNKHLYNKELSKYNRLDNIHSMDINSIVIPAEVIKQVKEEVIKMLVVKK